MHDDCFQNNNENGIGDDFISVSFMTNTNFVTHQNQSHKNGPIIVQIQENYERDKSYSMFR